MINHFKKKNKSIKNFLLDQNFVSGIGNIYASEILYLSKINPSLSAKYLKKYQCKNIVTNSRKILNNAIRKGGSTIRDFKNTKGDQGNFQKEFKVYGRDKQKCKRFSCLGTINKITQSNRSTFLCEICQKQQIYYWPGLFKQLYPCKIMANTKSAIKRIRRISKQTAVNKARKSRYKIALKKMNVLIENKKKSEALKFLPKLNSELMKIAKTGIIKKQNASRNISRITKKISSL